MHMNNMDFPSERSLRSTFVVILSLQKRIPGDFMNEVYRLFVRDIINS